MVEYDHKTEGKVKAKKGEIMENVQGTNSEGKETEIQINNLEEKEEINIQPEQNEETALTGVAQWIECRPANQRVDGSFPSLRHMPWLWARCPVGGTLELTTH